MSKYQICVSGAHAGSTVEHAHLLAYAIGAAVAKAGHVLTTGATIGLPQHAARGAKDNGGLSVGFSPASSHREHVKSYRLPTAEFDYINYTSYDYVGRDLYLVRSSDAVVTVGGGMGSLHEFSSAIESHKVCAVLLGSGGLADFIPSLISNIATPNKREIIFDTDPERLVATVIGVLDKEYADLDGLDENPIRRSPSARG